MTKKRYVVFAFLGMGYYTFGIIIFSVLFYHSLVMAALSIFFNVFLSFRQFTFSFLVSFTSFLSFIIMYLIFNEKIMDNFAMCSYSPDMWNC